MRKLATDYHCYESRTPIFESTDLFVRSVGETSDVVNKEMYTFLDKGGRSLTLRPEGTAPIIRAFVEKKLYALSPIHKFFYIGPMFRYERPQRGRFRQHHQFGVEMIGSSCPEQDSEAIDMLCELYRRLGLKNLCVMINTVGDKASRERYKVALREYFHPHVASLSEDSQLRFEKNVLRILDSKAPEDQSLVANAPVIQEFLTPESLKHFTDVCQMLDDLGLKWQINPKLVRGLDYYNHTVFEIVTSNLSGQNSLGGGGRYDGLIADLGGPDLPSVGWGTGFERILQAMDQQQIAFPESIAPFVYFIGLDRNARKIILPLVTQLRHLEIPSEIDLSEKKIQQALHFADRARAKYTVIIGEEELRSGSVMVKEMNSRSSHPVSLDLLCSHLCQLYKKAPL